MTRADTNSDGVADQKDKKTPIKWQILKQDGDDLFLLADQVLDCQKYNEEYTDVTWETCTLRSWLNSDFYDAAFSSSEKTAIKQTSVSNEDNPYYDTGGGKDTTDRLFLLSLSEIVNTDYGFQSSTGFYDQARHAKATDYAKAQGCYTSSEGTSWWWLRSPGDLSSCATYVYIDGFVDYYGYDVNDYSFGVRPALHLNLSSSVWKKGEIVTSEDKKTVTTDTLPSGDGSESGSSNDGKQEEESGSSGASTNSGSQNTDNQNTNTTSGSSQAVSGTNNGGSGAGKASSADATTVTAPAKVKSIKVTNKKKGKTVVSFKKVTGAAGYQIQYAKNKKFTKGKKSKTTKKTKYTIKKLTKKKTYYFRIRAYKLVDGTKKYGKWSAVKKLKIKK